MRNTELQTILHPTDYTEDSRTALGLAAKLCVDHHARLVVLHVVGTLGPERVTYGEATSQRQPEGYRQRLWEEFHRRISLPSDLEDVELILREGDPVETIVRTASEQGCDLIVMANHKRSGFGHWLFRGTTEKVLGRAFCPVLVVRSSRTPQCPVPNSGTELHPGYLSLQLHRAEPAAGRQGGIHAQLG